jgi:hypothetical protein
VNKFDQPVLFVNIEGSQDNQVVSPGQTAESKAQVPWSPQKEDFPDHFIMLSAAGKIFFIYQKGDYVYGTSSFWGEGENELIREGGSSVVLTILSNFKITLTN